MKKLFASIGLFLSVLFLIACQQTTNETYTLRIYDYDDTLVQEIEDLSLETYESHLSNLQLTREGYTFDTWTIDINNEYHIITVIASYAINTYTITWKDYDGTILEVDQQVPYLATPSFDGVEPERPMDDEHTYAFIGWSSLLEPITEDKEFIAQYIVDQDVYKVQFFSNVDAQEPYDVLYYLRGTTFNLADYMIDPLDEDHYFDNWVTLDGSIIGAHFIPFEPVNLYISWAHYEYHVRFYLNEDTTQTLYSNIQTESYHINDSMLPSEPTRIGYAFTMWTYDIEGDEPVDFETAEFKEDTLLFAQWELKDYYTEGLLFTLNGESYGVSGYTGLSPNVIVPSTYLEVPVTQILNSSFQHNEIITSIYLPESIESIGNYAFDHAVNLETINLPEAIHTIGSSAFRNCDSLIYDVYNNTLQYIDHWVMGLISDQVTSEITFKENTYGIYNMAIDPSVILPNWVSYELVIPLSIKSVTSNAFYYFDVVYLTDGIDMTYFSITYFVGAGQIIEDFVEFYIENNMRYAITSSGDAYVSKLIEFNQSEVIIPTSIDGHPVVGILAYALFDRYDQTVITNVIIPNTVTSIGVYAFYTCELNNFVIPTHIEVIGRYAFKANTRYFTSLSSSPSGWNISVDLFLNFNQFVDENDIRYAVTHDQEAHVMELVNDLHSDIIIPEMIQSLYPVVSILPFAFAGNTSFETMVIADSVLTIGDGAFESYEEGDSNLISVTLPNQLTFIGNYLFRNSTITSIEIPASVQVIGFDAFRGSSLASVILHENLNYISSGAFADCSELTEITIPSSVVYFPINAFQDSYALSAIHVGENNANYASIDGVLFNEEQTTLLKYPTMKLGSEYHIPNTVTTIGAGSFMINPELILNLPELRHVYISENVVTIDNYAFAYLYYLETVTFDSNDNLYAINNQAFKGNTGLLAIDIPDSTFVLGEEAFMDCTQLSVFNLPASTQVVHPNVFTNTALPFEIYNEFIYLDTWLVGITDTSIEIADLKPSTTLIPSAFFMDCQNLQQVNLPEGLLSIGYMAFFYNHLDYIVVPASVTFVSYYAFGDATVYFVATEETHQMIDDTWMVDLGEHYWGDEWHYDEYGVPMTI